MLIRLVEPAPNRDGTGEASLGVRIGLGNAGTRPRVPDLRGGVVEPVGVVIVVAGEPMRVPAPVVPAGGVVELLWGVWVEATSGETVLHLAMHVGRFIGESQQGSSRSYWKKKTVFKPIPNTHHIPPSPPKNNDARRGGGTHVFPPPSVVPARGFVQTQAHERVSPSGASCGS